MPDLHPLQIRAESDERAMSPAQKRFNALLRQIDKARLALKTWQDGVQAYRLARQETLVPLQTALIAGALAWVRALDAALDQAAWTPVERRTLRELLCTEARELLESDDPDPDVKALFDKHSEVDFDTLRRERAQVLKQMAERMSGLDLGDADEFESPADVLERLQQGMREQAAEQEAEQAERAEKAAMRRKTAAQQRREAEAREATQSVREVYRKLASALHPDRASDERQREEKTALMQRVNRAYEANDLLALLELQLQVEQIDASHIAGIGDQRLKHFNQVLADQLEELKAERLEAEYGFLMEVGLEPGPPLRPRDLTLLLQQTRRLWQADLDHQQRQIRMLEDRAMTKQWLKRNRQRVRRAAAEWDLPGF